MQDLRFTVFGGCVKRVSRIRHSIHLIGSLRNHTLGGVNRIMTQRITTPLPQRITKALPHYNPAFRCPWGRSAASAAAPFGSWFRIYYSLFRVQDLRCRVFGGCVKRVSRIRNRTFGGVNCIIALRITTALQNRESPQHYHTENYRSITTQRMTTAVPNIELPQHYHTENCQSSRTFLKRFSYLSFIIRYSGCRIYGPEYSVGV